MAVDTASVCPGHAQPGMLDGRSGSIFRLFHRLLDRAHGFIQIDDDALARTSRFRHAMAAIAQAVSVISTTNAQVLALPTSIAVRRCSC